MFKHLFALIDIAIRSHTTCVDATYVIKLKNFHVGNDE